MRCSRCSAPIVTPEQEARGLCAGCLTESSLSALVALAAQAAQTEPMTFTIDCITVEDYGRPETM